MAKIFFYIFQVSYVIYIIPLLNLNILTPFSMGHRTLHVEEILIHLPYTEKKNSNCWAYACEQKKCAALSEDVKRTASKGIILDWLNNYKRHENYYFIFVLLFTFVWFSKLVAAFIQYTSNFKQPVCIWV